MRAFQSTPATKIASDPDWVSEGSTATPFQSTPATKIASDSELEGENAAAASFQSTPATKIASDSWEDTSLSNSHKVSIHTCDQNRK